jgi:copper chaperone for superoxide dismutase
LKSDRLIFLLDGNLGAAVCALYSFKWLNGRYERDQVLGLARWIQATPDRCLIDISVSGTIPGLHGVAVNEYGDIEQGWLTTGQHYNPYDNSTHQENGTSQSSGIIGNIHVVANGTGSLYVENSHLRVSDIIGRGLVIYGNSFNQEEQKHLSGSSSNPTIMGEGILAGVIARSAGLFENKKRICSCSGKTLWEEIATSS